MSYLNQFLGLRCSGDVLNSVFPVRSPVKEISETMAIIKKIKKTLVFNPDKYTILDLCAGNCLTSSLIAHLFKVNWIFAIDKSRRTRSGFEKIRKFTYMEKDIIKNKQDITSMTNCHGPSIIISVHPCSDLAQKVIEIYNESEAEMLFLMPCCHGNIINKVPEFVEKKLSKYELWCMDLCKSCDGLGFHDGRCLSEKNIIIVASKTNDDIFDESDLEEKI